MGSDGADIFFYGVDTCVGKKGLIYLSSMSRCLFNPRRALSRQQHLHLLPVTSPIHLQAHQHPEESSLNPFKRVCGSLFGNTWEESQVDEGLVITCKVPQDRPRPTTHLSLKGNHSSTLTIIKGVVYTRKGSAVAANHHVGLDLLFRLQTACQGERARQQHFVPCPSRPLRGDCFEQIYDKPDRFWRERIAKRCDGSAA